MLSVLSKNKSFTSISIEKGILKAHGINSWIWDSDGCLWYGEQGAIQCRLAVEADDLDEAAKILKSEFTQTPETNLAGELPVLGLGSPPYFGIIFPLGILFSLFFGILEQTVFEFPAFIEKASAFPFQFVLSAESFVFNFCGIPPGAASLFKVLINASLAIAVACIIIGNRILFVSASIILATMAIISSPWLVKCIGAGSIKALLPVIFNPVLAGLYLIAILPVSCSLNLLDFYKTGHGFLGKIGKIFVYAVTGLAIAGILANNHLQF